MKAYMSEVRAIRPERDFAGDPLARQAFGEADRIMTCVEDGADYVETIQTLAGDRARDIAWDEQTDAGDAARALAEALAAFVGDEGRN